MNSIAEPVAIMAAPMMPDDSPSSPSTPKRKVERNDRRFLVNQPAYVSSSGVAGHPLKAQIRDISRRGMQLVLSQPIAPGPVVRIEWNGRQIHGTIRYQQQDGNECRAGVELSSSWESLVSDILAQQAEELRLNNLALERQAADLGAAEKKLVSYAGELQMKNTALAEALRRASEASEIKSRFLASISHEFRTPLNGIIGFSELLHDGAAGPLTDTQKDCMADILSCSQHLLTLINQVLDLTKIESGKMDFDYEDVAINDVVREVVDSMRGMANSRRIMVEVVADSSLGVVRADAARVRQVLYNYLSNALKFTDEGGAVMVRVQPHTDTAYRIEVEDNGIGIRPEDISQLFTEFSQLGASEKAKTGTGLGLAITRRIVEAQGGEVGLLSEPGKGTRFFAILPRFPQ
jgi:signal transduction histidine kinase